ncbi:MAG: T9SS C-terminal target domain-containing protein [Bacteroidetes bacterium]|nr:T9SS C-terminal target domain-containing protein [Bacteroidota bacterium]
MYPNPTTGPISLRLHLPEAGRVELNLVDVAGKPLPVWLVSDTSSNLALGVHDLTLFFGRIVPGCYSLFVHVVSSNGMQKMNHKIIVIQ